MNAMNREGVSVKMRRRLKKSPSHFVFLLFLWFRFLLGKEYDVVNVFVDPRFRVTQSMLILADSHTSLVNAFVLPCWFGEDVVNGLFGHAA